VPPPDLEATQADNIADPHRTGEWRLGEQAEEATALPDAGPAEAHRSKARAGTRGGAGDLTNAGEKPPAARRPADRPAILAGYQIVRQLGQGGMGTVYLARQTQPDRHVALKVLNPQWAGNPSFLARFTREACAAAQLVHPHIVQIYDIGAEGDIYYFSMEYAQGQSLGDLLQENGRLDPEVAAGYILQAARGLKHAHEQGMVHRDIKPDNLLLDAQGIVKVADLGLVKMPNPAGDEQLSVLVALAGTHVTGVGVAMGTPAYMAPEQGRNAATVDQRADIYSLGCTLYVLLTGRPPFEGNSAQEVITKHFHEPIVRPETLVEQVPQEISDVLVKMLAKKPEDRQANMSEVIADLENFLAPR